MPISSASSDRATGRVFLGAALALALAIQCAIALRSPLVAPDGIHFIALAQQLLEAPRDTVRRQAQHPGYPLLIAGSHGLLRGWSFESPRERWLWSARVPALACGALTVAAVWLLARRMFDAPTAGLAACLFAVLPLARQNAADALSDAPHLLCYALAAWAALAGLQTQGGRWFAAAGAASAAGYWIRPEGLSVAIVTAGLVLVRAVQAPAAGSAAARRRWAVGLASLTAATCLVAAPYVLLSGKVTGKLWNKQNLYPSRSKSVGKAQPRQVPLFDRAGPAAPVLGFASPAPLAIVDPQSVASVVAPLARAAWELVERSVSQLHLLLLLAALGCFWRRAARPQAQAVSLSRALGGFHVALLILLYLLGGYIDRRHLLPLAVLVVPWAACGLVAVSAWVSERMAARGRTWSPRFVTAGLLVVLLATMLPRSLRPLHEPYGPQLAAAAWIQRHTAGGEALVANSPYLGFYSGREFEVHGWSEYRPTAPLSDRIRTADARYIVLDTGASEHFDPAWLAALDGHYTLVQRIEGTGRARRHTVLIYEPTRTAERPPPSSL